MRPLTLRRAVFALSLLAGPAFLTGCTRPKPTAPQTALPLAPVVRGAPVERAPVIAVLLHGYGARGTDLLSLADHVVAEVPTAAAVVPPAPLKRGRGRMWYPLSDDVTAADARRTARAQIGALVAALQQQNPAARVVLAGFSQGAMMSIDTALTTTLPRPLAGLVGFSGGVPRKSGSAPYAPEADMTRLAHTEVVLTHGRRDPIVPFSVSDTLAREMQRAGVSVQFIPFDGRHTIGQQATTALVAMVRAFAQ